MKDENEIGALWSKTSAKGSTYMSGMLTIDGKDTKVVIFSTGEKKNPKAPDWRVLIAKSKSAEEKQESYTSEESLPVINVNNDENPF